MLGLDGFGATKADGAVRQPKTGSAPGETQAQIAGENTSQDNKLDFVLEEESVAEADAGPAPSVREAPLRPAVPSENLAAFRTDALPAETVTAPAPASRPVLDEGFDLVHFAEVLHELGILPEEVVEAVRPEGAGEALPELQSLVEASGLAADIPENLIASGLAAIGNIAREALTASETGGPISRSAARILDALEGTLATNEGIDAAIPLVSDDENDTPLSSLARPEPRTRIDQPAVAADVIRPARPLAEQAPAEPIIPVGVSRDNAEEVDALEPLFRGASERPELDTTARTVQNLRPTLSNVAAQVQSIVSEFDPASSEGFSPELLSPAASGRAQASGQTQSAFLQVADRAPVQASVVSSQLVASVARTGNDRVEIRLDPPELGRISLSLNITDQAVTGVVNADRADIVDLMRRHAEVLQRDLSEAGFGDVNLEFAQSDTGQADGSGENAPDEEFSLGSSARDLSDPKSGLASAGPRSLVTDTRLDIRL